MEHWVFKPVEVYKHSCIVLPGPLCTDIIIAQSLQMGDSTLFIFKINVGKLADIFVLILDVNHNIEQYFV